MKEAPYAKELEMHFEEQLGGKKRREKRGREQNHVIFTFEDIQKMKAQLGTMLDVEHSLIDKVHIIYIS